jgi:hypothetical protein
MILLAHKKHKPFSNIHMLIPDSITICSHIQNINKLCTYDAHEDISSNSITNKHNHMKTMKKPGKNHEKIREKTLSPIKCNHKYD